MELYIMRHAHARHNLKKIMDENPNNRTFLTKKGILQAKRKSLQFERIPLDIILASKFPRAVQTAGIISRNKILIRIDARLNERKTGLDRRPVSEWKKISKRDKFRIRLPKGESFQDEKRRLKSFLASIMRMKRRYGSILVVSHGEPVQILNGLIKKMSDKKMASVKVRNIQLFRFKI